MGVKRRAFFWKYSYYWSLLCQDFNNVLEKYFRAICNKKNTKEKNDKEKKKRSYAERENNVVDKTVNVDVMLYERRY